MSQDRVPAHIQLNEGNREARVTHISCGVQTEYTSISVYVPKRSTDATGPSSAFAAIRRNPTTDSLNTQQVLRTSTTSTTAPPIVTVQPHHHQPANVLSQHQNQGRRPAHSTAPSNRTAIPRLDFSLPYRVNFPQPPSFPSHHATNIV